MVLCDAASEVSCSLINFKISAASAQIKDKPPGKDDECHISLHIHTVSAGIAYI